MEYVGGAKATVGRKSWSSCTGEQSKGVVRCFVVFQPDRLLSIPSPRQRDSIRSVG